MKKSFDTRICELMERASANRMTLRQNIEHLGQTWESATESTPHKWSKVSTLCMGIWNKKKTEPCRIATERAIALFREGYRILKVCIVPPNAAPDDATLGEQEARGIAFFESQNLGTRRINAELEDTRMSVGLVAQHVAMRDGRLAPHAHTLLFVDPFADLDASAALARLRRLLAGTGVSVAAPGKTSRDFIVDEEDLIRHVAYLHGYPISIYGESAVNQKASLRDALEKMPALFLAAISSLADADFTFKGSVVKMGWLRKQPDSRSTKISKNGPIRVVSPTSVVAPDWGMLGLVKASEAPDPAPRKTTRPLAPTVALQIVERAPRVLYISERPSKEVEGLMVTVALLEGCRGWSRIRKEEEFPRLGAKWKLERLALRFSRAGHSDADAMRLAHVAAAVA